jgi:hypothetical protein
VRLQTKHLCPAEEAEERLAEAGVSEDMLPWAAGEVLPIVPVANNVLMMMLAAVSGLRFLGLRSEWADGDVVETCRISSVYNRGRAIGSLFG